MKVTKVCVQHKQQVYVFWSHESDAVVWSCVACATDKSKTKDLVCNFVRVIIAMNFWALTSSSALRHISVIVK